jgi:hypothetical protein
MRKRLTPDKFCELIKHTAETHKNKEIFGLISVFGGKKDFTHRGHDIDVLVYPAKDVPKGEFVKAEVMLLENLNKILEKEYNCRLITFQRFEQQVLIEHLSGRKEGDVLMHNLIFTDRKTMEQRMPFFKQIFDKLEVLFGSKDALKYSNRSNLDYYYFTAINTMFLTSHLPQHVLSDATLKTYKYITEHVKQEIQKTYDKKISRRDAESQKLSYASARQRPKLTYNECRKMFFDLMDFLDRYATNF